MSRPCPGCGLPVERDPIGDLPGWLAALDEAMTVWHDECLAQVQEQERCEEIQRDAAERLDASGMPAALVQRGRSAEFPRPLDVLASSWALEREPRLLLTGPFGVGKTTLAAVAAHRRLDAGKRLVWASAPALMARIGSGLGSPGRDAALATLHGRGALVLDDIDKVRPTEYGAEQVFVAVDERIVNGAPLLVTTNLAVEEIASRWPAPYGEAIASRLAGECRVVEMRGQDRRLVPVKQIEQSTEAA